MECSNLFRWCWVWNFIRKKTYSYLLSTPRWLYIKGGAPMLIYTPHSLVWYIYHKPWRNLSSRQLVYLQFGRFSITIFWCPNHSLMDSPWNHWLVLWNHGILWLSRNSWESQHPNRRNHIFQRGWLKPPTRINQIQIHKGVASLRKVTISGVRGVRKATISVRSSSSMGISGSNTGGT